MTVCLAYISPGTVSTHFHESVVNLLQTDNKVTGHVSMISGPRIAEARNDLVRHFLGHPNKPEWMFMVDADMEFAPDVVAKFLSAANPKIRPVIGGLAFGGGRVQKPFPTLYALVDPKDNNGLLTKVIYNYPVDALCKIDATGAACLFMHREVLQQMGEKFKEHEGYSNPHPWFAESVHRGHSYGEDWAFFMRLRAMGIPAYVHTGIRFGHHKSCNYDESYYKQWRKHNDH